MSLLRSLVVRSKFVVVVELSVLDGPEVETERAAPHHTACSTADVSFDSPHTHTHTLLDVFTFAAGSEAQ